MTLAGELLRGNGEVAGVERAAFDFVQRFGDDLSYMRRRRKLAKGVLSFSAA
jgi:hypothetical protein